MKLAAIKETTNTEFHVTIQRKERTEDKTEGN
jgi:hypothetical protein